MNMMGSVIENREAMRQSMRQVTTPAVIARRKAPWRSSNIADSDLRLGLLRCARNDGEGARNNKRRASDKSISDLNCTNVVILTFVLRRPADDKIDYPSDFSLLMYVSVHCAAHLRPRLPENSIAIGISCGSA